MKSGLLSIALEYKGLISAAFLLMFFSGFGQSVFIGSYLPELQSRYGIDNTTLGSVYALATLTSAALVIWTGKFLDQIPLRRFIMIILGGLALGCVLLAYSIHLPMLFLAFLLLRQCGQGLLVLSGTTAINRYIEDGRGRALSIAQIGLPAHVAVFPLMGIFMLHTLGFQNGWLAYAAFIICILMPVFWVLLRNHEEKTHKIWQTKVDERKAAAQSSSSPLPDDWTRRRVLMDWRFYLILSITIVPPCFGTALFFYQTEIANALDMSAALFAGGFTFFTLASVAGSLLFGVVMDKYGEKWLLLSFPILYAAGLAMLYFASHLLWLYIALSVIGFGGGIMSITGGPLFARMYGTTHFASIKSLSFTAAIISSAISPPLTGWLLDQGINILNILLGYAAYAFLAWILITAFIGKFLKG